MRAKRAGSLRLMMTLGGVALLAPIVLVAQERPDSLPPDSARAPVAELQGIVVRASRAPTVVGGVSAIIVTPDSLELAPAAPLEQALRALPFVQVRENSRAEAEISVRGSESRQVAVLVDGVPLSLGWDHRADPSVIPLTGAQQIVFSRGLASVLHGPNALGGVIEVGISQAGVPIATDPEIHLGFGLDHLGTRGLSATGTAPIYGGAASVRAGMGYRLRSAFALPARIVDSGRNDGRRTNSDLEQLDGFMALRWRGATGRWAGVSASGYRAERGVPPELHVEVPRLWRYPATSRVLAALSGGTGQVGTPLGEGDVEASVGIDVGSTQIESFETLAYENVLGTEASNDRTLTLRLLGDHTLVSRGELRAAITAVDVRHDESLDGDVPLHYHQRLWSIGSEVAWPIGGMTRLTGGVVLDGADTPRSADKPPLRRLSAWGGRVGVTTLTAGATVRLHAALSSRARFPSLRELYSGSLGRFEPNPALRPERLLGGEVGATGQWPAIDLQAVAFHHELVEAIVRASTDEGAFRRENRDRIRSTGVELAAGWRRGGVSVLTDLMLQDVRVMDAAAPAAERRPEHQPGVRANLDLALPIAAGVSGSAGVRFTGRQYCVHTDLRRSVPLDAGFRTDFGASRTWRLGGDGDLGLWHMLRAALTLENATDAALFDQCGLPRPGRTLRLSVQLR